MSGTGDSHAQDPHRAQRNRSQFAPRGRKRQQAHYHSHRHALAFGGYDLLVRSAWDGELEIEVGVDLLRSLNALAAGETWAEGEDHRIGRIGRDAFLLSFDRGTSGKVDLHMNGIQLAEMTSTIRDVQPDGQAAW